MEEITNAEMAVESVETIAARKNASPLNDEPILYKTTSLLAIEDLKKTTANRRMTGCKNPKNWGKTKEEIARRKKSNAQYQMDYSKKMYRKFSYKANGYAEAEICWILDHSEEGIKEYFTRLIKEDMKRNPDKACYQIPKEVLIKSQKIKDLKKDGYTYNEAIKIAESI